MTLAEPAGVYRPRHPERTVVYRVFEEQFERYVREHEVCFEARDGALRDVPTTVEAYNACGRLEGGFARVRCDAGRRDSRGGAIGISRATFRRCLKEMPIDSDAGET